MGAIPVEVLGEPEDVDTSRTVGASRRSSPRRAARGRWGCVEGRQHFLAAPAAKAKDCPAAGGHSAAPRDADDCWRRPVVLAPWSLDDDQAADDRPGLAANDPVRRPRRDHRVPRETLRITPRMLGTGWEDLESAA